VRNAPTLGLVSNTVSTSLCWQGIAQPVCRSEEAHVRLLIVEADEAIRRLVANRLERQNIEVVAAETAAAALAELAHTAFDVAIFDLMLPDGSGIDLLRVLRERGAPTHVIVLSDADSEGDRVHALGLGADDYVAKPFFVRELTARVLAVRRRQVSVTDSRLVYGTVTIDLAARQVTIDDQPIRLTAKEFDLLAFLAARPRHAFSRDELLRSVWQSDADWQQVATVTEHMRRLRTKIEVEPHHPRLLHTVRGVGYRFDPPAAPPADDEAEASVGGPAAVATEGSMVVVDGLVVSADAGAVQLMGVAGVEDLLGTDALEQVAPQSMTAVLARQGSRDAGKLPGSQVVAIRRADGTDIYLEFTSAPLDWQGRPGILSTMRATADPSASLRHLVTGVFSEVSDAVIVTDPDFHVRSWNGAAERLYGWAEHEVLGRQMNDVIPMVGAAHDLEVAARSLEEHGRWYGEPEQIARDGSSIAVFASTTLIRDDAGEPLVIVSVNRRATPSPTRAVVVSPETQDEAEIRRGLDHDEFVVHYQPVVDLDDLHVIGVEALARWEHPQRGTLTPAFFIDAAERSGVILELGRVMFDAACRQTAAWRRAGCDLEIAINLSTRQLAAPTLYDDVVASLAASDLDPHALWLEVTETALVEDLDLAAELLHRLAALGIRVAIDDFGTGWASLAYLKQFPVHALKIDHLFVDGVDHNPQDAAIARSIISLGHELDMIVIAEGVETAAQQASLQELGCEIGQGYRFGKPTPVDEVPIERARLLDPASKPGTGFTNS
jgi:PAS domain S-box-containing protein